MVLKPRTAADRLRPLFQVCQVNSVLSETNSFDRRDGGGRGSRWGGGVVYQKRIKILLADKNREREREKERRIEREKRERENNVVSPFITIMINDYNNDYNNNVVSPFITFITK